MWRLIITVVWLRTPWPYLARRDEAGTAWVPFTPIERGLPG